MVEDDGREVELKDVRGLRDVGLSADPMMERRVVERVMSLGLPRENARAASRRVPSVLIAFVGLVSIGVATAGAVVVSNTGDENAVPALTQTQPVRTKAQTALERLALDNDAFPFKPGNDPVKLSKVAAFRTASASGTIGVGQSPDGKSWTCYRLVPGGAECTPTRKIANGSLPGELRRLPDGRYHLVLIVGRGSRDVVLTGAGGKVVRVSVQHGVASGVFGRGQIGTLSWRSPAGKRMQKDLSVLLRIQ